MKQKTISRRINKELEKLMPGEYSYTQVDKLEIMINDYLLYFVFPDTYPFKSPKVYIKKENGKIKDYIDSFTNFKRNKLIAQLHLTIVVLNSIHNFCRNKSSLNN